MLKTITEKVKRLCDWVRGFLKGLGDIKKPKGGA